MTVFKAASAMVRIIPRCLSSRPLKALELPGSLNFHAVQQQLQIGPAQGLFLTALSLIVELALLESFAPQTITAPIKVQHLHVGPASVDEHEQMPAHRVFPHLIAYQCGKPVKLLAHVSRLGIQPDSNTVFREEHQPRRRRRQTPSPRSSSMSQPEREEASWPRSIQLSCSPLRVAGRSPLSASRRFHRLNVLSASFLRLQNALWLRPHSACSAINVRHCSAVRRLAIDRDMGCSWLSSGAGYRVLSDQGRMAGNDRLRRVVVLGVFKPERPRLPRGAISYGASSGFPTNFGAKLKNLGFLQQGQVAGRAEDQVERRVLHLATSWPGSPNRS